MKNKIYFLAITGVLLSKILEGQTWQASSCISVIPTATLANLNNISLQPNCTQAVWLDAVNYATGIGIDWGVGNRPNYQLDVLSDPSASPLTLKDVNIACPNCTPVNSVGYRIGDTMEVTFWNHYSNIYLGYQAGNFGGTLNDSRYNACVGAGSGASIGFLGKNVYGDSNSYVGYNSGYSSSQGAGNTAVGAGALFTNQFGDGNVAVGSAALWDYFSPTYNYLDPAGNVAVGANALAGFNLQGAGNTAIGYLAGSGSGFNTGNSGNTFLGSLTSFGSGNTNLIINSTAIGIGTYLMSSHDLLLGGRGTGIFPTNVGIDMSYIAGGPLNRLDISYYMGNIISHNYGAPCPTCTGPDPYTNSVYVTESCMPPSSYGTGASGLRFSDLTDQSTPFPYCNSMKGYLTVDDSGNVLLAQLPPTGIGYCTNLTSLTSNGGYDLGANQVNFYYSGQGIGNPLVTDVLIGYNCGNPPVAKLNVLENSGTSTGSIGCYVENDDNSNCNSEPVIGIKSFIPGGGSYDQVNIAGWFEADNEPDCCGATTQDALFVPPNGGGVSIGLPVGCPPGALLAVQGTPWVLGGVFYASDSAIKTNVQPINNALSSILQLKGVSYKYIASMVKDTPMAGTHYGFIAQQVGRVIPAATRTIKYPDGTPIPSLEYTAILPYLVEGMKQQQQSIDSLRNTNNMLVQRVDSMFIALQGVQSCIATLCNHTFQPKQKPPANPSDSSNNGSGSNQNFISMQDVALSNPSAPILYQNQPNPYGEGGTKINYFLPPGITSATMVFYDTYGNQLKTVTLSQTGMGTLNINPQNLASGIYTYSMIVNGQVVDTKRMILTK